MSDSRAVPLYRRGDQGQAVAGIRARLELLGLVDHDSATPDRFDDGLDRAVRASSRTR